MAFLFKSKKNQERAASASKGESQIPGSQLSLQSNGRVAKDLNEKGGLGQSTTPQSSVNTSLNSLGGGADTPSPEQPGGRTRLGNGEKGSSDLALRNISGNAPAVQPLATGPNAALYPWSQRRLTYTSAHPSPFPRYGAAVNAVASKEGDIYLMGGLINSSTVKGDLWMVEAGSSNMACYPLATTAESPGPRVGHASLLVGNAFIVYGGDTKMVDSDVLDETLYLLNTSTRQWSRALPANPRPSGRYGHSLNILGSKIYVFGGQVEGYFMNDLVAFDLNQLQLPSNRWEMLIRNVDEGGPALGQVPPARTNHSIVSYNERLYLFGGTNGFQWFNDVWCYDPIPNAWSQLDCIGYIPAPREGHAAAIVDDVMYIFGGRTEEGADLGDLAAFRISSRRWYTFQNMGPSPSPRSGHSMTAYNKQIVVLAGEPSSATREAQDLSIVYLLDTTKIRYPNDQQIQQTPAGERVGGSRRPSNGDKTGGGASRGLTSRDGGSGLPELKRLNSVPPNRSGIPNVNGNDSNGVAPGSAQPQQGPAGGSKLPRASLMQAPSGPPPQQQAPAPRQNGIPTTNGAPRLKTSRDGGKQYGPQAENQSPMRSMSVERDPANAQNRTMSPQPRESPSAKESPLTNGTRTPTQQLQQPSKVISKPEVVEASIVEAPQPASRSSSKSRIIRGQNSTDSTNESILRSVSSRPLSPPPPSRQGSNSVVRKGSGRNSQSVALLKELEVARNRNAWLASELELAKKGGYTPSSTSSPILDRAATEAFGEADRPLIEALIAMRTELANVQGSVDQQAVLAAKKIAEVEKQRDAAVSEAVYAKAKFAAHGGSASSTPQLDNDYGMMSSDRSSDIGRRLATALAAQKELQNQLSLLTAEIEAEKRGRQLAEDTTNAAQKRMDELETYKRNNASEVEILKAELHEVQKSHREQAITCAEAVAAAKLLHHDKEDLESRHKELLGTSKDHTDTFDSLREAIAASAEMKSLLERKLEEERLQREKIEDKLHRLRSEHEDRTAELETTQRKLRDAEEIAEKHALEARTHQQAVMSGLDKVVSRGMSPTAQNDGRTATLQAQVNTSNELVRKYQAAADKASEKLRGAEERIAGLEAYQEQASREGLSIRKQLQVHMRETQSLQAANSEMKYQLANQQLETNAVHVQHNTLKDLLTERGVSPGAAAARSRSINSPQLRTDTPDHARLRDLEQQVAAVQQAHEETKQTSAMREQQADAAYRDKLSQLENDYQSAVHYVKGTEKMLKRMKDELSKYKSENSRLKTELDESEIKKGTLQGVSEDWETERNALRGQIENLQAEIKSSHSQLEAQMASVHSELQRSNAERDQIKQSHGQLTTSMHQARTDLSQLQEENQLLERRAMDAEQKVSLLLDQVESSVDSYRRQSRQAGDPMSAGNSGGLGGHGHSRNLSEHSMADSTYSASTERTVGQDRNSMALDSLASELETLRTQWETTNKNYRLSNQFDFERQMNGLSAGISNGTNGRIDEEHDFERERTPTNGSHGTMTNGGGLSHPHDVGQGQNGGPVGGGGPELSSSLADWRKRLDSEESNSRARKGSTEGSKERSGMI